MKYIIIKLFIMFQVFVNHHNKTFKENIELKEYRKNAMLLLIEQNEVIDKYQSSRNAKLKNKKIIELSQKLN